MSPNRGGAHRCGAHGADSGLTGNEPAASSDSYCSAEFVPDRPRLVISRIDDPRDPVEIVGELTTTDGGLACEVERVARLDEPVVVPSEFDVVSEPLPTRFGAPVDGHLYQSNTSVRKLVRPVSPASLMGPPVRQCDGTTSAGWWASAWR